MGLNNISQYKTVAIPDNALTGETSHVSIHTGFINIISVKNRSV